LRRLTQTVTDVTNDRVIINRSAVNDLLGNPIEHAKERVVSTDRQFYVSEYSVGKKWTTRFEGTGTKGNKLSYDYDFKVVAKEHKTVPAGTFDAYKVVGLGYSSAGATLQWIYWIAPDKVSRPIAYEFLSTNRSGDTYRSEGQELVSYSQRR
jgi:hypothetical protein